jgi:tyrosyl-tRNA synthetase
VEVAASEFPMAAFALFVKAGLAGSNGEARRLIRGGGARVNDVVVGDEGQVFEAAGEMKLSAGKKLHVMGRLAG